MSAHPHAPSLRGEGQKLIETAHLDIRLGGRLILHDVGLAIGRGEIVTIVGPNGSGKSTLLKALIGAIPPARGTVTRAPGLRIGYVPQRLVLDGTLPLTVSRFLDLPHRAAPAAKAAALEAAGAGHIAARQMADLSGGQFQRVLLARAILTAPDILILDEPTQALDQAGQGAFYSRLEHLRRETGCAILLVSHELHVVMSASDRVICLNGHVCCEGTPEVVRAAPEWRALFGTGTLGTLALYRHEHDHGAHPDHVHAEGDDHGHDHGHSHGGTGGHRHEERPGHAPASASDRAVAGPARANLQDAP